MDNFILSGFADEASDDLDIQIETLKELKIEYIELRKINGLNIADYSLETIRPIKRILDGSGIKVSSIGSPAGKIQITDPFEPELDRLYRIIELAHCLETEYVRVFSFYIGRGWPHDHYRERVLDRMERFCAAASGSGITLLHENEKGIYGDTPERCLEIAERCPEMGLVFDPANFIQCSAVPYPHAYRMLKPYIKYMHIKDAEGQMVVPAGMGSGHIREILADLKASGFTGFLSLEPHLRKYMERKAQREAAGELLWDDTSKVRAFKIAASALNSLLDKLS